MIIIGGGPAGSQCALWLKHLGITPCIIEKQEKLGGLQNDNPYFENWTAIVPNSTTGIKLANQIHSTIANLNIPLFLSCSVLDVDTNNGIFRVKLQDHQGQEISLDAPYLVIASGVIPKTGNAIPSEKVIIGPGSQIYFQNFSNKKIAIFGGGDNAFENYLFIRSKGAVLAHIYARSIRASKRFLDATQIEDVFLGEFPISDNMQVGGKNYDLFIVMYGWAPSISFLSKHKLEYDTSGYLKTNSRTAETSIQNVYAIGEVANRMHPCCATSMADGVVAAKAIQKKIESTSIEAYVKQISEKPFDR